MRGILSGPNVAPVSTAMVMVLFEIGKPSGPSFRVSTFAGLEEEDDSFLENNLKPVIVNSISMVNGGVFLGGKRHMVGTGDDDNVR